MMDERASRRFPKDFHSPGEYRSGTGRGLHGGSRPGVSGGEVDG